MNSSLDASNQRRPGTITSTPNLMAQPESGSESGVTSIFGLRWRVWVAAMMTASVGWLVCIAPATVQAEESPPSPYLPDPEETPEESPPSPYFPEPEGTPAEPWGPQPFLGMEYVTPIGNTRHDSWLYPTAGFFVDESRFQFELLCPIPFLAIDLASNLIQHLRHGNSDGLPIMRALNGDKENSMAANMLSTTGTVTVRRGANFDLRVGAQYALSIVGARMHADTRPDELPDRVDPHMDISFVLNQPGLTLGIGVPNDEFNLDLQLMAGNGFGRFSYWNPFYGGVVTGRLQPSGQRVGLFFRTMGRVQRIDYSGFEPNHYLARPHYDSDERIWTHSIDTVVGITATFR